MRSNPFLRCLVTDSGSISAELSKYQLCKETKMSVTANEMYHLTEARKNGSLEQHISHIECRIDERASEGCFCAKWDFNRGYTLVNKIKDHFIDAGFQVSEEKDREGDPRLVFSWENAKE